MRKTRFVLVAGLVAPSLVLADPQASSWRSLARGLEFRLMDGGAACRKGSRDVAVVRLRPERWRLDLFHYAEDPNARDGYPVDEWRKRTGGVVAFNAGQYYPDRAPMGLFVKEGRNLGTKQLRSWKGLLAAEPRRAGRGGRRLPRATIIDLDNDPFNLETTPYRLVMQSFMLLDRAGRKRVRRSDWHANRTIVATDHERRLLVLHTEGAYTLWDLADWMARSDLRVRQALSMDGGFEAQMCVRAGGFEYLSFGQYHVDDKGDHSIPGFRAKLPAVVGVMERE